MVLAGGDGPNRHHEGLAPMITPLPKSIATVSISGTLAEKMEAAAAIGSEVIPPKVATPQNPMDFEYFEKLVRSDDEAKHQVPF